MLFSRVFHESSSIPTKLVCQGKLEWVCITWAMKRGGRKWKKGTMKLNTGIGDW